MYNAVNAGHIAFSPRRTALPESDFCRCLGANTFHLSNEVLSLSPLPGSIALGGGPVKAVEEPEVNQPLEERINNVSCALEVSYTKKHRTVN